jgi:cytochrome c biogenesis protein CcmG, thiol:disulfide interchange protein DsbE
MQVSESTPDRPGVPSAGGVSRQWSSGLWALVAMSLFMLLGTIVLVWLGTPHDPPPEGQQLGRLELKPLLNVDGPKLSERDLRGEIVVLHFWGTWCEPCRTEFPEFVKLADELSTEADVQVLSVSCSPGSELNLEALAEETRVFLQNVAPAMPTYSDPTGMSRAQVGLLLPRGAVGYPCTVVLDREGVVAGLWQGDQPYGMQPVLARVRTLLARSTTPASE